MNKRFYIAGISAVALLASAVPAAAFAEDGVQVGASAQVNVNSEDGGTAADASAQATATATSDQPSIKSEDMHDSSSDENVEHSAEVQQQEMEKTREDAQQGMEQAREGMKQEMEITREALKNGAEFLRESTTSAVYSLAQLQQSIEQRKQELDDEEASSTQDVRAIMANANPVRLAVHSLLASKDILGGIGQQVSTIAQQVNDSIATTTAAEAQIQSRGFLSRLFFGGDSSAADEIAQTVSQNDESIQKLTDLINQAGVTADVKATLEGQITALQDSQARLKALAEKEKSAWGIFSWRF